MMTNNQLSKQREKSLAVFIDADNVSFKIMNSLFAEIAKFGKARVKRIYGDWTSSNLDTQNWKETIKNHALYQVQQSRNASVKNATDIALVVDAMDFLYTNNFDAFCIVSSDSDYTRLASRIRESNISVYGFGEEKTPKALINSCDKFIYTELLNKDKTRKQKSKKELQGDKKLVELLKSTVNDIADHTNYAHLIDIEKRITNQYPDFNSRNYGYDKLKDLIKAIDLFEFHAKNDESGKEQFKIKARDIR